jgi:urease accessory protein
MPAGAPGKCPFLRLGFERHGERSALVDLECRAPLLVQQALYMDEAMPGLPWVFIISTSGGILQGDRNAIEIRLAPGAQAHVTTQAATRIHEMDANYASQTQDIALGEGAYLEYLPDLVIPQRHARFLSRTRIAIEPSATLLYSEIVMPGRKHYGAGELFEYDVFSSTVRAERPDGAELFTEKVLIEPRRASVRHAGVMGGFDVFATVILLTPPPHAERIARAVPAVVSPDEGWAAGASRLPDDAGLVYRVVGMESLPVRRKVREFWALVRPEVAGAPVPEEARGR